MRENVVEELFSVFASSDRAEALAGDLAEERQQRGWEQVDAFVSSLADPR